VDDRETRRTPEAKADSKPYSQNVCMVKDHKISLSLSPSVPMEKENVKVEGRVAVSTDQYPQ